MYGAANAVYWKSSKKQNSTHLTVLKHRNTKTSLYRLSKNDWVNALFFKKNRPSEQNYKLVFHDHPVICLFTIIIVLLTFL